MIWSIICAGGAGIRAGLEIPKQFLPICGKPMFLYSAETLSKMSEGVVMVCAEGYIGTARELSKRGKFSAEPIFSAGGKTRQQSVFNGLKCLKPFAQSDDIILIHDAARPFVTETDAKNAANAAKAHGCSLLCARAVDTIKTAENVCGELTVSGTLNRDNVFLAQTPQAAKFSIIFDAHESAERENFSATDDCSLLERLNFSPRIVISEGNNFKVTVKEDFALAEYIAQHMLKL